MIDPKKIDYFKNLSIKNLKIKAQDIKSQLPKENRKVITYSKNFTISLSNYCQNLCGYCFYNYKLPKLDGEENVILISNDKIVSLVQKAIQYNCKEALLISGERPDSFQEVSNELKNRNCDDFVQYIIDICLHLLDLNLLPHTNVGVLNYEELKQLKKYNASMGLMLESTSMKLFEKGEVHENSPGKLPEKRKKHIKDAGKLKIPFTTGLLLGIGENFNDRIRDLYLIKEIHEEFGHIQEVIIQNFEYKAGIKYKPEKQISIQEILKIAGIAKLIFENEIAIQVPPNLIFGFEKDFIDIGVDDFGGISPITIDFINPEKPWPQIDNLKKVCENQGFYLRERLPIYNKFLKKKGFCSETIKKRIDNINIDDYFSDF
ncbi:MAG: 7,8-didemethyl-8-hydroxy-5-deazariboflavin synthase subunit CofG [Promethearchaeota archaeon]